MATRIVQPCYFAFVTSLHMHGWTLRAPRATYVASLQRSRLPTVHGHPVRRIIVRPHYLFGSTTMRRGSLEFPVADEEKAIVDAFHLARHCGGIEAVIAATERAGDALDQARLEAYAVRTGDRSLCSRLGYVLEALGVRPRLLGQHSSRILVRLDQRAPLRGHSLERWHVIHNV